MKMKLTLPALFFFLCLFSGVYAQDPYLPEPSGQVVSDYEDLLTKSEKEQLAGLLKKSYNSSSNQLMIVCIPTKFTGGLPIEDYANKLFKKWQPGQKDLNNGIMMIISGSRLDSVGRKVRFEVGYGLEGALPDLLCKRIQMEAMVPLLKEHRYYDAISNGAKGILDAISAENVGKKPVFRFKVKNEPLLKDETGLLSTTEFTELTEQLKSLSIKNEDEAAMISMNEYMAPDGGSSVSLQQRWSGYPIFKLEFPHPYKVDTAENTVRILRVEKPGVYLNAYCWLGQSEEERIAMQAKLTALLDEGKYADALKASLTFYEEGRAARMKTFYIWVIAQIALGFFTVGLFYYIRSWMRRNHQAKIYRKNPAHVWLTVFYILAGFVFWINAVTFEILQISYWAHSVNGMPDLFMWVWGGVLFVFHITGIVYLFKISALKEKSLSKFWSSRSSSSSSSNDNDYSYSSSSSSYSSSSDDSYSSSSSSSDSNDDYGGGGGDSGGGGSSSDW